ncbi:hypothetical protein [Actibacterium sp. XHP0104]|uniref:hypothetical protein n=1 Tax=Actibacterium sp. XHP0104 TaxID=2984335 RepID=UPI0021E7D8CF|nr:hypothetical protein [Actibacterium sp. XHP0104]MCV2880488.1 hypothetical protein [Actibacterium sp. XHP0104]
MSLTRPLMLVLATGLMLKSSLMMYLGESDYTERVSRLNDGTKVEAIGAVLMQPDDLSRWLSETMSSFLDDLV